MTTTPLEQISVQDRFALTADVLGNIAYNQVMTGLQADSDLTLTGCQAVNQNARLLTLTGTLADFVKQSGANISVRVYIFETVTVLASTERHCLLLISDIPATYHVGDFWNAYASGGSSAVNTVLSESNFSDQLMLFSTLNYNNSTYLEPDFPPRKTPSPRPNGHLFKILLKMVKILWLKALSIR